jgi:rhamnogalacturonan endolyase
MRFGLLVVAWTALIQISCARGPFLKTINETAHIIGNDIWNVTIGQTYGTKLFYKNRDCVGNATGHYVSYSKISNLVHPLSCLI